MCSHSETVIAIQHYLDSGSTDIYVTRQECGTQLELVGILFGADDAIIKLLDKAIRQVILPTH